MKVNKLLIVVPAFNEEKIIASVIQQLKEIEFNELWDVEILLIDDASTDETLSVIMNSNVKYISLPINFGISQVFQFATKMSRDLGFDFFMMFDGDGQHPACHIQKLLDFADSDSYVVGIRDFGVYPISTQRLLAINLIKYILLKKFRLKVNDPTSGFRLIPKKAFPIINEMRHHTMFLEDTVMMLGPLAKSGMNVIEVKVDMSPRHLGVSSSTGIRNVINYLSCVTQLLTERTIK
jgi:glycosyltransferase involved in cell wall biosynthesis